MAALDQLADAEDAAFRDDEEDSVGEELRLRYRYLDLRKERMRDTIALRHEIVRTIREHLNEEGFLEIETPILTRSTPRGRATFSCRAGSRAARGTRCRSRPSSSSSC